jgi:hypothetical protein
LEKDFLGDLHGWSFPAAAGFSGEPSMGGVAVPLWERLAEGGGRSSCRVSHIVLAQVYSRLGTCILGKFPHRTQIFALSKSFSFLQSLEYIYALKSHLGALGSVWEFFSRIHP